MACCYVKLPSPYFPVLTNQLIVLLTEWRAANQYKQQWGFPINEKIIQMWTCPIDLCLDSNEHSELEDNILLEVFIVFVVFENILCSLLHRFGVQVRYIIRFGKLVFQLLTGTFKINKALEKYIHVCTRFIYVWSNKGRGFRQVFYDRCRQTIITFFSINLVNEIQKLTKLMWNATCRLRSNQ